MPIEEPRTEWDDEYAFLHRPAPKVRAVGYAESVAIPAVTMIGEVSMNTPSTKIDDPSQPHVIVATPREGGDIVLNVKTILFALALFAGGGIGGGSLSFFSGHDNNATKEAVEDLKTQISQIQSQLSQINNTVLEMSGELKNDAVVHKQTADTLADHEQRLRTLEHHGR